MRILGLPEGLPEMKNCGSMGGGKYALFGAEADQQ